MNIESLRIGPEKNFTYLIECPVTKKCALVDPSFEQQRIKKHFFDSHPERQLEYLIATHGHWDHAGGFPEMLELFPKANVVAGESERKRLKQLEVTLDLGVKDNSVIEIGILKLHCLHTPGHTEGGTCFYLEPYVFTGDTLFVSLCGRTDLPGGSDADLFNSLQKLKSLPPESIILPGHDYGPNPRSTISAEIKTNPSMMARTLSEFIAIP